MSVLQRIKFIVKERGGFFGMVSLYSLFSSFKFYLISSNKKKALYRGIAPGTLRSFFANGCAMVVMSQAQKKVTDWGLRDD
jgi:hypothetical protein